ncbi:hypothetical protein BGZ83_011454, partial [Gryganskiella cystojenkinii]
QQPLSTTLTPHDTKQRKSYPFPTTQLDQPLHSPSKLHPGGHSSAPTTPFDFITNSLNSTSPMGPLDTTLRSSKPIPMTKSTSGRYGASLGTHQQQSQRASTIGGQTMIEIDKILKREDSVNDFVPPKQAMNSDDSDFDWDEDINFDDNGQVCDKKKEKPKSTWREISPFLRMLILIIIVAPILALPAVLVEVLLHTEIETDPDPSRENRNQLRRVRKDAVVTIFSWLSFMWCIICITNWGIDIIPQLYVRICSVFAPAKVETFKSQMLIFVATKKYVKWLLDACWAVGSFAVLAVVVFPLIAYADRIKANKYALSVLDKLGTSRRNVKRSKNNNFTPMGRGTTVATTPDSNSSSGELTNTPSPAHFRSRQQSRSNSWDDIMREANRASSPENAMTSAANLNEKDTSMTATSNESSERPRSQSVITLPSASAIKRPQRDLFKGLNRKLHGLARADIVPAKDINSTENAKRLARTLFHNLQGHGDELVVEDFYTYFETEDDAQDAFALFDKDGNGDISKREMKEKIFYIYKERKDLHTSLRDLSQAVGKLDIIFLTIVAVIWLLIILSIFGTSVVQNMLSIGSFLVALSFVFGNSLRTLFENIVFLFITHPYDSGDLCDIEGMFMYVREVGLNSTMFVTWDGKRIYYPNNVLSQKAIHNIRRSPNMSEKIVLLVDVYTPQAKILELRARMRDYLAKEGKEFSPEMEIQIQEIDVQLKISMVIEHKGNWQDTSRRWARRTKFHYALKEAIEDLGIKYYAVPKRLEILQFESCGSSINSGTTMHSDSQPPHDGGSGGQQQQHEHEQVNEDTLLPGSTSTLGQSSGISTAGGPFRNYTPEQVARLYKRSATRKPLGDSGSDRDGF